METNRRTRLISLPVPLMRSVRAGHFIASVHETNFACNAHKLVVQLDGNSFGNLVFTTKTLTVRALAKCRVAQKQATANNLSHTVKKCQ